MDREALTLDSKELELLGPVLGEADRLQTVQEGVVVQVVQFLTGVVLLMSKTQL